MSKRQQHAAGGTGQSSPSPSPAAAGASTATNGFPFQFRLPKAAPRGGRGEVDPFFGLNRSAWNGLLLPVEANQFRPPVKSVVVKKRGARRGLRLVLFSSAKEFFDRLAAEQASDAQPVASDGAETPGEPEPQAAGGVA